jgi:hypothetical protein
MSEKNDNFDDLKHLLKLKRHEIPPPGYFNGFSSDVMARIRAGDTGRSESLLERLQEGSDFWGNLVHLLRVKPGIIGALATTACLFLLASVLMLDHSESDQADTLAMTAPPAPMITFTDTAADPAAATPTLALNPPDAGITVSTNPMSSLQPVSSMFGSSDNPLFQPVGYVPASQ